MSLANDPRLIPLSQKKKYLLTFSEDDFRDKIVRPLYAMQGLVPGKDTCGTDEEGKDCYFWEEDKIRKRTLWAVQTKRGNLNLASKARDNLLNAEAQLRTALATHVYDSATKQRYLPTCVVLATSGEINNAARRHVAEAIQDPRIVFNDVNDFVPLIDEHIPEFWNGIDSKTLPYLKNLREYLIETSKTIDVSDLGIDASVPSPITDEAFTQLHLHRYYPVTERRGKEKVDQLQIEELTIQKLLTRNERLVLITGDAGAGKTTTLHRLALLLVTDALKSAKNKIIPIVLHSLDIAHSNEGLAVYAGNATKRLTADGVAAFGTDLLVSGNVTLLIDGLDELGHETERSKALERIGEFHAKYPRCQVILASRDYPFVKDVVRSHHYHRFHISPISFNQASKMVSRLARGQSLSRREVEETLRRLENVHGLELNPLLITVFVATSDYCRSDVPANITEIFKKFTEIMLGRWGRTKGVAHQYHAALKDFLLQRLAFRMHQKRDTTIRKEECRCVIEQELRERGHEADIDILFNEIVYGTGLIREHGGEISFCHLLFQEFFAGRAIQSLEFLGRVVSDVWWTKAIVFYFGDNPDDSHGLTALRDGLKSIIGGDEFQAAVTVGLAAQACYLMKSSEKAEAVRWVVDTLASCKDDALAELADQYRDMELLPVLYYYIYGRDAVAARVIVDVYERIRQDSRETKSRDDDAKEFWCIAGMIEAHKLDEALAATKEFSPEDPRLLLGLHLGAVYVENLHVTTEEEQKKAKALVKYLNPKIDFMRPTVVKELRSLLLEVQRGQVKALEMEDSN